MILYGSLCVRKCTARNAHTIRAAKILLFLHICKYFGIKMKNAGTERGWNGKDLRRILEGNTKGND